MSFEAHLHAEGCNFEHLLCCQLRINIMSSRNQKCTYVLLLVGRTAHRFLDTARMAATGLMELHIIKTSHI